MNNVTALILAGGFGTRLRSVVRNRPKALAQVVGKPFLTYLLDKFQRAGLRNVVICTGYLASQIVHTYGNRYGNLRITYSKESTPLGTAGALALALPHVASDLAIVANGDTYFEADLTEMLVWHQSRRAMTTILLTKVEDVSRYGQVSTDNAGNVTRFHEKGGIGSGWINAGVYLLGKPVLQSIPQGQEISLERKVFPKWINHGLCAWKSPGGFLDIGTAESFAQAQDYFA